MGNWQRPQELSCLIALGNSANPSAGPLPSRTITTAKHSAREKNGENPRFHGRRSRPRSGKRFSSGTPPLSAISFCKALVIFS